MCMQVAWWARAAHTTPPIVGTETTKKVRFSVTLEEEPEVEVGLV